MDNLHPREGSTSGVLPHLAGQTLDMARFSLFLPISSSGCDLGSCGPGPGAQAQIQLVGNVVDGETGEPMFSASVTVDGTSQGVMTDFDGRFSINVASLPVTLNVSFIGYSLKQVQVTKANQRINVKLIPDQVLIETAEVVGERISDKQKQSPLTV